jgi:4-amino-4-deoxy-L-arabinose transferase-like glycosyltransferase
MIISTFFVFALLFALFVGFYIWYLVRFIFRKNAGSSKPSGKLTTGLPQSSPIPTKKASLPTVQKTKKTRPSTPKITQRIESGFQQNIKQNKANALVNKITQVQENTQKITQPGLLLLAIALAGIGQLFLQQKVVIPGIIFYILAFFIAVRYILHWPENMPSLLHPAQLTKTTEIILLVLIIALAIFFRFNRLMDRPYGYEGDGSKIVAHTYYHYFAHEPGGMTLHFENQPTTFFLQAISMGIGGISFASTRALSAVLGSLSVLLFYFILRRISSPFSTLVATFFYAVGFTALSAARQTHIETSIEVWVLLTYFLMMEAVFRKKNLWFILAGVASAAGMLSFETFYMTPVVSLLFLYLSERKQGFSIKSFGIKTALFLLPMLPFVPILYTYNVTRLSYHFEPMAVQSAEMAMASWISTFLFLGKSFLQCLQSLFYQVSWFDSLINWPGGLVNPLLLPFFIIGLALMLAKSKPQNAFFLGLWFLLQYFPFGILGAAYPRVLFPGVIAVYALAGWGFSAVLTAFFTVIKYKKIGHIILVCILLLTLIAWVDSYIFWEKLIDPEERQERRELSDLVIQGLDTVPVLVLPYILNANDATQAEVSIIELSAAGVVGVKNVRSATRIVPFPQLLATIHTSSSSDVGVIFEKSTLIHNEERDQARKTLETCYPDFQVIPGRFFDLIILSNTEQPHCYGVAEPQPLTPNSTEPVEPGAPLVFEWQNPEPVPLQAVLHVQRKNQNAIYLEAETVENQGGWYFDATLTDKFNGTGYLTDSWQSTPADTKFTIASPGAYTVWVRSFKRLQNDQHSFLSIDNNLPQEFAINGEDTFFTWVWENVGTYTLEPGEHNVTLSRTYGIDFHFQIFVDAIAISSAPDFNPVTFELWQPYILEDISQDYQALNHTLSQSLEPDWYRWNIQLLDENRLVDWQGNIGVSSPYLEFQVNETN